jgi:hypothetical protein
LIRFAGEGDAMNKWDFRMSERAMLVAGSIGAAAGMVAALAVVWLTLVVL